MSVNCHIPPAIFLISADADLLRLIPHRTFSQVALIIIKLYNNVLVPATRKRGAFLEECIHLLDPVTCSSCKGAERDRRLGYHFHDCEGEVLLKSTREFVHGFKVWYPYGPHEVPTGIGTVHIAGGWSCAQVNSLVRYNPQLCWVEFAPSHRFLIDTPEWHKFFSEQPGGTIGIRLRRCS